MNNEVTKVSNKIERLCVHDHSCFIYSSQAEQFSTIIPFVQIGLEKGEKCIYIVDENSISAVSEAMSNKGIDVSSAIDSGILTIVNKQETYLRQGYFDPDLMIDFLKETINSARIYGYSVLRIAGEMSWALGGESGVERLIEYEAKLNGFFPDNSVLAICQYNRNRFDPETIINVIHSHPLVIYRDTVNRNICHIPPNEMLKNNPLSCCVDKLLDNIITHEQLEIKCEKENNDLEITTNRLGKAEEEVFLLEKATIEMAKADDLYSALSIGLHRFCEIANWDYGEAWLPSSHHVKYLAHSFVWYDKLGCLKEFAEQSEIFVFQPHVGLSGEVWALKGIKWIEDVATYENFCRVLLAKKFNIKTAVGFPIIFDNEVLAVLNFFKQGQMKKDDKQLKFILSIASLLSMAIGCIWLRKKINDLSYYDATTGIPNRVFFEKIFAIELIHAKHDKQKLAVMILHSDNLKTINDSLGYDMGDKFLQGIANSLKNFLHECNSVSHYIGSKFVIILPKIGDRKNADMVGKKIIEAVRNPFMANGCEYYVAARVGIALYPDDGGDVETLLEKAEIDMACAKK